ncbi:type I toxin-antitoxin system SymE family toxin [Xanthomonas sp. NCPPB 2654]|uniref:SymE family type I addiction module toxin n=1 Tax=unclassified Xanthomonas TaxID=2643310 RepID=UPI0021E0245A|nr:MULTISPECIES: type I toxin-antitoxin system SymE family toxin [unclassified Xanthomonas]MDL5367112.1 type I toxin-antitoxin system SymE family toxin [Xanthomonas sp. NCPPB 2654]UYC21093.1 type I toxin-antitoxin system SymE family toxin [Xanthomonas sp. CFBP 8443]
MSRKAAAPQSTSVSRRCTRKSANPFEAAATSQMLGLSLGNLSRTTLFNPVPTEDELPPRRSHSPRCPRQCTVGYVCQDVLIDGRRQSRRTPTLRLSGQWLAELGFAPGSKPHIAIVDGALVITPTV